MDPPAAPSSTQSSAQSPAFPSMQQLQPQQHSPTPAAQPRPISPARQPLYPSIAASPSHLRSNSPRPHCPASSEIFERNVQEPVPVSALGVEMSDAHVPAHVMTEDAIPPALEASVQAITSGELNPDEVEIVTSASHQPAGAPLDGSASHADLLSTSPPSQALPLLRHEKSAESDTPSSIHRSGVLPSLDDDGASSYGQLDPSDVRRLSFISFKDIVHSEHQQAAATHISETGSRHGSIAAGSSPPAPHDNRATSPLRAPPLQPGESSHGQGSSLDAPPASIMVPSIAGNSNSQHGDLTIETMRQALRKTASGDLSGVRSSGMSPVTEDNAGKDVLLSRTNS